MLRGTLVNLSVKCEDMSNAYGFFSSFIKDHGNSGMAGAVPMLMEVLVSKPVGGMESAVLSFLAIFASHLPGSLGMGKAEEAVPVLVEILRSGSLSNKENAATILVEICSTDERCLVKAREHGVTVKLMDLVENCTGSGQKTAGQLLKKIQDHPLTDRGKRKVDQSFEDIQDYPLPPTKRKLIDVTL